MKLFNYTRCLCLSFSLLVLASCNVENPIDGEQYIKQVYLVGAYDKLQGKEVAYGSEREIFVSVAIGGTVSLDHDVTIRLEQADYINIDNYNKKNVVGALHTDANNRHVARKKAICQRKNNNRLQFSGCCRLLFL